MLARDEVHNHDVVAAAQLLAPPLSLCLLPGTQRRADPSLNVLQAIASCRKVVGLVLLLANTPRRRTSQERHKNAKLHRVQRGGSSDDNDGRVPQRAKHKIAKCTPAKTNCYDPASAKYLLIYKPIGVPTMCYGSTMTTRHKSELKNRP